MFEYSFSQIAFLFIAYSILGWACETLIASLIAKRFINRGMMFGPYDPAYGIGVLFILVAAEYLGNLPPLIFLISATLATVVELLTVYLFKKVFYAKWWEHDTRKLDISIKKIIINFLVFGILGILIVYFIDPHLESLVEWFHPNSLRVLCSVILGIIILDMIFSIASLIDLRSRLVDLMDMSPRIREINRKYHCYEDDTMALEGLKKYNEAHPDNIEVYHALCDLNKILDINNGESRLLNFFPQMVPVELAEEYIHLKNAHIDFSETEKLHIGEAELNKPKSKAYNMNLTKLVLVFLIGCVVGYIIETMYCVLHNGYFESRQGMIYGPFSQVYGFGAVLLTLCLEPISRKKTIWLFLFSAVIGGLFEAGISLAQEFMFGTTSWDYSDNTLSILGGRTSGEYMFVWGLLGTGYMRLIYPKISHLVDRAPKRVRRVFTIAVAVILSCDLLISGIAVERWSARQNDIHPANSFEKFIDSHYNDDYMRGVYPHMKIH